MHADASRLALPSYRWPGFARRNNIFCGAFRTLATRGGQAANVPSSTSAFFLRVVKSDAAQQSSGPLEKSKAEKKQHFARAGTTVAL
jgi:hypothetical protein